MGNFATRFKQLRLSENLTQQEIANSLKLSKSSISMYENESRVPDLETLETIADFFNVDLDYLTGRNDKKSKNNLVHAEPDYDGLIKIYTRSKNNLSQEEKMKLARIILSDNE